MPSPEFWIIHSAHTDRWVAIFPNSLKTTLRRKKSETGKLSLKDYLFNSPGRISQTSHPPTMSIMGTGITAEQICVPPRPPSPPHHHHKPINKQHNMTPMPGYAVPPSLTVTAENGVPVMRGVTAS